VTTLQNWTDVVAGELGVRLDEADVRAIPDLARVAAHQVERPAAPVMAFLVGLAVGAGTPLAGAAGEGPRAGRDLALAVRRRLPGLNDPATAKFWGLLCDS
jgi:Domain of unknown function (DUF6457)